LERRARADRRGEHVQLVPVEAVVGLRIRDGGVEHPLHVARRVARHEGEDRHRLGNAAAANLLGDELRLARRSAHVAGLGANGSAFFHGSHQARLTSVLRSPEWPRKVRVGANSPSLCPTIASVTKTGTCLRPSWTAIVWPSMAGTIMERLDHVLMTFLVPLSFWTSTFLMRWPSTKGPFLRERGMVPVLRSALLAGLAGGEHHPAAGPRRA